MARKDIPKAFLLDRQDKPFLLRLTSRLRPMATHTEQIRLKKKNIQTETMLKCPHCSFLDPTKQGIKTHIKTVHKVKPYQCPHCSSPFSNFEKLRKHIKADHPAASSLKEPYEFVIVNAHERKAMRTAKTSIFQETDSDGSKDAPDTLKERCEFSKQPHVKIHEPLDIPPLNYQSQCQSVLATLYPMKTDHCSNYSIAKIPKLDVKLFSSDQDLLSYTKWLQRMAKSLKEKLLASLFR